MIGQNAKEEARQQYAERQEKRFERLARYSLDPENQKRYVQKEKIWKHARFRTGDADSREYAEYKRPLANFHAVPREQVVGLLRKDSEEWIQKLTEEEKKAIRKYTCNSGDQKPNRFFERLNAMLRGEFPEDKKIRGYAECISRAVRKNKLDYDVIAYRGMNLDPSEGIPINGLYRPKQFFSTSVVRGRSFDGKYKIIIYVKKGSNGAYIENLSYFKQQREASVKFL